MRGTGGMGCCVACHSTISFFDGRNCERGVTKYMTNKSEKNCELTTSKPKPQILYKFRCWNQPGTDQEHPNHRRILTKRKLWVPSASTLNDPFDCCIPPRHDLLPRKDLVARFVRLRPVELTEAQAESYAERRIEEIGLMDDRRKEATLRSFAEHYRANSAILSFATTVRNPLLWAHYSDSHHGLCFGLYPDRLESVLKDYFFVTGVGYASAWIDYVSEMPVFVPASDDDEDLDLLVKRLTTKSSCWDYEKEYRYVFFGKGGFDLELDSTTVSEIVLGSEMKKRDVETVCALASTHYPSARITRAERKPFSYDVDFDPVC